MPDTPSPLRKKAAIVIADVVNYSRLMQRDEIDTLSRLTALRVDIINPSIQQAGGRIIKLMGDGLLTEFPDAAAAVHCAIALQQEIAAQQASVEANKHMLFRIGINVGEVLIDADDIYGHGVNIAARLEKLSPVGGICISETVYAALTSENQSHFSAAGAYQVKNIERPIAAFIWQPASLTALYPRKQPTTGHKPTLALAEFSYRGAHPDIAAFTQGVYETTLSYLANLTGLMLVNNASDSAYHASGVIQAQGQRYRVTVRLVDQQTGQQFWSERFDGELKDLFDTQDRLAYSISNALRFTLYSREGQKTDNVPIQELSTEELTSRASLLLFSCDDSSYRQALMLLQTALTRDEQNFMVHAMLANAYIREGLCGFRCIDPSEGEAALSASRRAAALNPGSDYVSHATALVEFFYLNDLDAAQRSWQRSLEINPFYAMAHGWLGGVQIFQGDPDSGLARLEEVISSRSLLLFNFSMHWLAALGYIHKKNYAKALDLLRSADQQAKNITFTLLALCATATLTGDPILASKTAQQIMQKHPDFRISAMRRWPFSDEQVWQCIEQGLRDAGLPE